ncbi:MAG: lipocalin family protein [Alphaproteobacteria bacterium]|nr:lipocalin family protein [Alphaproteobacteria bacterium]
MAGCLAALGIFVLPAVVAGPASGQGFDADPVAIERYLGAWYEAARTPNDFEDNTIRRGGTRYGPCYNATATYALEAPGRIAVLNRCTRGALEGEATIEDSVRGEARVIEGSGNRRLSVAFGPGIARFVQRILFGGEGNYWIYCRGPRAGEAPYQWAVVSGPDKDFVFVLTREKTPDADSLGAIAGCLREEALPAEDLVWRQR